MPDRSGLEGSRKIVGVVSRATKNDLVFVLISGGGSALLPLPAAGLSLSEKQRITAKLLRSGATIQEINVVRKHLSAIKGGQLLRHTNNARVISLILSDVIDDDLSSIASGPTSPDASTFEDALRILTKYRLDGVNDRAMRHIQQGLQGSIPDTPKPGDRLFDKTHNVIIGNNEVACAAVSRYLSRRRIKTVNLGSRFDGEAKDLGLFLARIARDLKKCEVGPFAIVLGGETTVTIASKSGMGGRNKEAGLSCATRLPARTIVACMGTDGIDGNSDAAGSLVSAKTRALANKKGLDLARYLARHDSYVALKETNSLIFTGRTGTNVNDIAIIYSTD
jgi:glycerate-2-kinase